MSVILIGNVILNPPLLFNVYEYGYVHVLSLGRNPRILRNDQWFIIFIITRAESKLLTPKIKNNTAITIPKDIKIGTLNL